MTVSSLNRVPTTYRAPMVRPAVAEPTGGGVISSLSTGLTKGNTVDTAAHLAHLYNAGKTGLQGGKVTGSAMSGLVNSVKGLKGNGIFSGLQGVFNGALPFAKRSAIFEGAISVVSNGIKLAQGQIRFNEFGARVVGDTSTGFVGGAGAAVAGGLALAFLPITGTLGTIVTGIAGIAGYALASSAFKQSSIYRTLTSTVRNALG